LVGKVNKPVILLMELGLFCNFILYLLLEYISSQKGAASAPRSPPPNWAFVNIYGIHYVYIILIILPSPPKILVIESHYIGTLSWAHLEAQSGFPSTWLLSFIQIIVYLPF